jgi:aminopeptidase N
MQAINRCAPIVALLAPLPAIAADPGQPPLTAQTARSGAPLAPEQAAVRFDSGSLAFEIFPDDERIAGDATLRFTTLAPIDRLVIDLDRNLPVSRVEIDGKAIAASRWTNPDGRLSIALPAPVASGQQVRARIVYAGTPHVAVRAPWDGGFVWARTPDGKPWVATAIQGLGCDLFWPCIDHPRYEPDSLDIAITVPVGLSAPSNGRLMGVDTLPDGRTRWRWRVAKPTLHSVALNIGPYREIKAVHRSRFGNDIPMHFWHLEGNEEPARGLFAEFAPTIDFFEQTVGPYPFADEKMGVVETPHLGMEHQTINAYGNQYRKGPEGFDWLLHHEFAHEWFANQMTVGDWDDFWLHEAYAQYMQPLYGRAREGEGRYMTMMLAGLARFENRHPIVSGTPRESGLVSDNTTGPAGDIYFKGGWMLHTLRGMIGDDAFGELTRRAVYGRPDPRPGNFTSRFATTEEYRRLADQVAGRDLGWFFDVYLGTAALPVLEQQRSGDTLTLAWRTEGDRPFPMAVPVTIDGAERMVEMPGGRATLRLPAGARLEIDPARRILSDGLSQ